MIDPPSTLEHEASSWRSYIYLLQTHIRRI